MFNKKSQVTVFIIIGIVMLISTALFIYFKLSVKPAVQIIVPPELMPVQSYVESCIKGIAEDGITTLGINGGYITFPDEIESNPRSYLASPVEQLKNPYWWYDGTSAMPTEDFIKAQISDYVSKELKNCLKNFTDFSNDFDIEPLGEIEAITELAKNDVVIEVKYPLRIKNKLNSTISALEDFKAKIPVRLKAVYELARAIMEKENSESFLEKKTIDLIVMDPAIPTTDVEIGCDEKRWYIPEIEAKLKKLLRVNLPYIKIKGAKYDANAYVPNPFVDRQIFNNSYFSSHYVWEISEEPESYKNMHASFTYDSWPMQIAVRPNNGQELRSNSLKGQEMLSLFCLHVWHFTYDVVYPVKVTIVDDKTAEHGSYAFNFAFKVSVNHNMPDRASFATVAFKGRDRITDEEFCSELGREVTIYTDDDVDATPLKGVNLTFSCGRFECNVGKSEWLGYGAAAGITKKLPYCVLGVLRGNKDGYKEAEMFAQSDAEGRSYTLYLTPIKEIKNYNVVKHAYANPALESSLEANEKATIMLASAKKQSFSSYGVYPTEKEYPLKFLAKDDNSYDLSIYLIKGDQITGGYKLKWDIGWNELKGANEITFHVLESPLGDDDERYLFLSGLDSYSAKVPKPEIK